MVGRADRQGHGDRQILDHHGFGDLVVVSLLLRIPKYLQESDQASQQTRHVAMKTLEGVPPRDRHSIQSSNADLHQPLTRSSPIPEHRKEDEIEPAPSKSNAEVPGGGLEKMKDPAVLACFRKLLLHRIYLVRKSEILRAQAPDLLRLAGFRFRCSRATIGLKIGQGLAHRVELLTCLRRDSLNVSETSHSRLDFG